MQCTYNVTLWRISVAILQRKQPCIMCVLFSYMSLSVMYKCSLLRNSAFVANLPHSAANFTYQFLKEIIF